MQLDQHQQCQLHPVMHSYLMAVHTVGDGNCLFHSVWKHLFPEQHETADSARFMRQITLYTIYKKESFYRGFVSALGYDYNLNDYVRNIMQMGSYCGDLALTALADALNRHIYCYNSFVDSSTSAFFFDTCDFESLQSMFQPRRMGTWQHNIYTLLLECRKQTYLQRLWSSFAFCADIHDTLRSILSICDVFLMFYHENR